jgi:hypothetical protein
MLNLEDTLVTDSLYWRERDLYSRGLFYSFGLVTFIELLRSQVPEVRLLQLIPGYYLVLIFTSFLVVVTFSDYVFRMIIELDHNRFSGTKTIERFTNGVIARKSFLLFFGGIIISFWLILPLSLDSFNSYSENALENLWSFDELSTIEGILFILLLITSQIPLGIFYSYSNEQITRFLPDFWRITCAIIVLLSGILTPTVDGSTQIVIAVSSFSLFTWIIIVLVKRVVQPTSLSSIFF